MQEVDSTFRHLNSADGDMFVSLEAIGAMLTNEARTIQNLVIMGQVEDARQRSLVACKTLDHMQSTLRPARRRMQDIQGLLGYVDPGSPKKEAVPVIKKTVTKIDIGGNVINSPISVASDIKKSFNAIQHSAVSPELKSLLGNLHGAVAEMASRLSDPEAELATRDLKDLAHEATSATPRENWWRRAADGLLEAARKVADAGAPVVDLVSKITTLLQN
jgi:hypothetical protein